MTFKVILAILTQNSRNSDNSLDLARNPKFAPKMHPGILSAGIENGGVITFNGFELESPSLHQICILGFS